MKKIIFTIFLSLIFVVSQGQVGVHFIKNGNLKTVFDMAKAQNKTVFIEIFSPTCHVCQAFIPTFDKPNVGAFYDPKFVSYKLDVNSQEAQGFLGKQNLYVPSIPILLFFDKDVNLKHVAVMGENANSAEVVINAAKTALDPNQRSSAWKASYHAGNHEPNFLIEYANYARITKDTADNILAMNEYFKKLPKEDYANNTSFLVLQKLVMDDENGLFKYMISHLDEFRKKNDPEQVKQVAENILMYSLYSSRGNKYSLQKLNEVKANLAKLGIDKNSIRGRTWNLEATAYFKAGQADKAISLLDTLLKSSKPSQKEYQFICNYIKSRTSDKTALNKAAEWCKLGN